MSEVKQTKRKGVSGANKGKAAPFRLNGWRPDWELARIGAHKVAANHTGAHLVQGAIGGVLAAALGYRCSVSDRLANLVDQSLDRCPTGAVVFDLIEPQVVAVAAE